MNQELLQYCKFYKGEEKCPFKNEQACCWDAERVFVNSTQDILSSVIDDYVTLQALNGSIHEADGVNIGIKAILCSMINKQSGLNQFEQYSYFRAFFEKHYLKG